MGRSQTFMFLTLLTLFPKAVQCAYHGLHLICWHQLCLLPLTRSFVSLWKRTPPSPTLRSQSHLTTGPGPPQGAPCAHSWV